MSARDWASLRRDVACVEPRSKGRPAAPPAASSRAHSADVELLRHIQGCTSAEAAIGCFEQHADELNIRHVSEIFKHIADDRRSRRQCGPPARVLEAARQLVRACGKRDLRNLAFLACHISKACKGTELSIEAKALFRAIVQVAVRHVECIRGSEMAVLTHGVATADMKAPWTRTLLCTLTEHPCTGEQLRHMKTKELSNFVWVLSQVGGEGVHAFLVDAVPVITTSFLDELTSWDASQLAYAYAKAGCRAEPLFEALAARAPSLLPHARSVQDIANLLWAFAWLELPFEEPFVATCRCASRRCQELNEQETATVMWAMSSRRLVLRSLWRDGSVSTDLDRFLDSMAMVVLGKLDSGQIRCGEALAKIAFGFSNLLCTDAGSYWRLFEAIAEVAARSLKQRSGSLTAQDAAWLAMTFAWTKFRSRAYDDYFVALSNAVPSLFSRGYVPQNIGNLAWAAARYARVRDSARATTVSSPFEWHHRIFDGIASLDFERMKHLGLMDIAAITHGLACGGYAHFACLQQLSHRLTDLLAETSGDAVADAVEVSLIAWSYAVSSAAAGPALLEQTFAVLAAAALRLVSAFSLKGLCRLAWSLAVADFDHPALLSACHERLVSLLDSDGLRAEDCGGERMMGLREVDAGHAAAGQLQQWQLWAEYELHRPNLLLPSRHRAQVHEEAVSQLLQSLDTSRLQADVGDHLEQPYASEHILPQGYSLDWARPEEKIAIEVDGPWHFMRMHTGEHVPTGATILKLRQLRALGWLVVSVPYYEWRRLGVGEAREGDAREDLEALRCEYLRDKVAAARPVSRAAHALRRDIYRDSSSCRVRNC